MDHKRGTQISSLLLTLSFISFLVTCVIFFVTKSTTVVVAGAIICLGLIVAGVATGMFVIRAERRARAEELEALAKQLGWEFNSNPGQLNFLSNVPESLNVEFLGGVLEGKTKNLMTGSLGGMEFAIFDQIYLHGVGEDARETVATCIVLKNKQLQLPVFRCEPRKRLHAIFKFLLSKETTFRNHPKFSQTYRLYGPEDIALRQTFSPTLLRYLEETTPLTLVGAESHLIVLKEDAVFSPDEIPDKLNETIEIMNLLQGAPIKKPPQS